MLHRHTPKQKRKIRAKVGKGAKLAPKKLKRRK